MTDPLPLCIEDLTVGFDRGPVLNGVSLNVHPGDSLALVGPNGAGKSTLLRAVLGLVPIERGAVSVLGSSPVDARRNVAYVPQSDSFDPEFPISALDVVLQGRYRHIGWGRWAGRADKAVAQGGLERVGMGDRARVRFGTLSGGQRQRVLLARAIVQGARLLLLDEPFNGVDATSQQLLVDTIDELRADGVAVVVSTHDLAFAHLACSQACLLNGHVIAVGSPDHALSPQHLAAAYGPALHSVDHGTTIINAHTH